MYMNFCYMATLQNRQNVKWWTQSYPILALFVSQWTGHWYGLNAIALIVLFTGIPSLMMNFKATITLKIVSMKLKTYVESKMTHRVFGHRSSHLIYITKPMYSPFRNW